MKNEPLISCSTKILPLRPSNYRSFKSHVYIFALFLSLGASYSFTASASSLALPLLVSVSGLPTQIHAKQSQFKSCPDMPWHGRALSVMFCPIFLSPFRSKCCGRALSGFVLTRVLQKEQKRRVRDRREEECKNVFTTVLSVQLLQIDFSRFRTRLPLQPSSLTNYVPPCWPLLSDMWAADGRPV